MHTLVIYNYLANKRI